VPALSVLFYKSGDEQNAHPVGMVTMMAKNSVNPVNILICISTTNYLHKGAPQEKPATAGRIEISRDI
jgi:hypothetical protein